MTGDGVFRRPPYQDHHKGRNASQSVFEGCLLWDALTVGTRVKGRLGFPFHGDDSKYAGVEFTLF